MEARMNGCPVSYRFDGKTFSPSLDGERLSRQIERVYSVLVERGCWFTLRELSNITGDPEASVSARLRDLRKPRFGSQQIERKRRTVGCWEYRLTKQNITNSLFDLM